MVLVNFHIEKNDYEAFKLIVGGRNVSSVLRNFVLSHVQGDSIDERKLKKQFEVISDKKKETDDKFNKLKTTIDKIENTKKIKEIKRLEKEKKEKKKMQGIERETAKSILRDVTK